MVLLHLDSKSYVTISSTRVHIPPPSFVLLCARVPLSWLTRDQGGRQGDYAINSLIVQSKAIIIISPRCFPRHQFSAIPGNTSIHDGQVF